MNYVGVMIGMSTQSTAVSFMILCTFIKGKASSSAVLDLSMALVALCLAASSDIVSILLVMDPIDPLPKLCLLNLQYCLRVKEVVVTSLYLVSVVIIYQCCEPLEVLPGNQGTPGLPALKCRRSMDLPLHGQRHQPYQWSEPPNCLYL